MLLSSESVVVREYARLVQSEAGRSRSNRLKDFIQVLPLMPLSATARNRRGRLHPLPPQSDTPWKVESRAPSVRRSRREPRRLRGGAVSTSILHRSTFHIRRRMPGDPSIHRRMKASRREPAPPSYVQRPTSYRRPFGKGVPPWRRSRVGAEAPRPENRAIGQGNSRLRARKARYLLLLRLSKARTGAGSLAAEELAEIGGAHPEGPPLLALGER